MIVGRLIGREVSKRFETKYPTYVGSTPLFSSASVMPALNSLVVGSTVITGASIPRLLLPSPDDFVAWEGNGSLHGRAEEQPARDLVLSHSAQQLVPGCISARSSARSD